MKFIAKIGFVNRDGKVVTYSIRVSFLAVVDRIAELIEVNCRKAIGCISILAGGPSGCLEARKFDEGW